MLARRSLLLGLGAAIASGRSALAAPAVVRTPGLLMPVCPLPLAGRNFLIQQVSSEWVLQSLDYHALEVRVAALHADMVRRGLRLTEGKPTYVRFAI